MTDRNFDWAAVLRKYYANEVKLKTEETKQYIDALMPNVERILKYVNKEDPRFSREPGKVGSFWQKLKVTKADEFDFNVQIKDLGSWVWEYPYQPRYYRFNRPVSRDLDTVPADLDVVSTTAETLQKPRKYHVHRSFSRDSDTVANDPDVVETTVPLPISNVRYPDTFTPCEDAGSSWASVGETPPVESPGGPRVPLPPPPTGYEFLPRGNDHTILWEGPNDLVRGNDVVPFLVKRRLKQLVTDAIRDLDLRGVFDDT